MQRTNNNNKNTPPRSVCKYDKLMIKAFYFRIKLEIGSFKMSCHFGKIDSLRKLIMLIL